MRRSSLLLERFKILLCLGRPRTCIPGTIAYALGFSYTAAEPSRTFVLGATLSFLLSFSANLHNTLSDTKEDSFNLPGRTTLLDQLGTGALKWLLIVLSAAMMVSAWLVSPWFLLAMVGATIGLHQYSFPPLRAKANPVFGLLIFAQAVGFPFIFGLGTAPAGPVSAFAAAFVAPVLKGELPVVWTALEQNRYSGMFVFIVVWFIAKGFVKNIPDYEGDKATGLITSATIFATRRYATVTAKWITLAAHVSLAALVLLRLEDPLILWSLVAWLPFVWWNANRLLDAKDPIAANTVLKTDMMISSGFIATLLMLVDPAWYNAALIAAALAVLLLADRFALDSRRTSELPATSTLVRPSD